MLLHYVSRETRTLWSFMGMGMLFKTLQLDLGLFHEAHMNATHELLTQAPSVRSINDTSYNLKEG
ncbi:uncharacterized protein TRIVIDRAFT_215935 [Trichoderma virens Gv29-8]|uniref:Uncharacterized protein n=1 Tax=Hypocrea virens (strain Gv29-8 / FGSC 10586) TaxID=413071 RepID=G9MQ21_HYPVG|nr:uncharacterized protein TRIVIDRAFT_215935 [Trichoderma virens Gv29-8]EHK23970.1 hypothetical protein TRIVIDRAFT_215935 [Trichoderma virens Gv29-8]